MNINGKNLLTAIAVPLAVGGTAALLTQDAMESFGELNQPPLFPPAWLFPIVWTILYILMGTASYFAASAERADDIPLLLYALQLLFNFLWPVWFFNLGWYRFALLWLVLLWLLILATTVSFARISRTAATLMIPYLLWTAFAGYLNTGIAILN